MSWIKDHGYAVYDFETTGVDTKNDRAVQLAVQLADWDEEKQDWKTAEWHTLINPGIPIPEGAAAIHGIREEQVADAPNFAEAYAEFHKRADGRVMMGYNALHFDVPLLQAELERAGYPRPKKTEIPCVDPIVVVKEVDRFVKGKGRHKLTTTAKRHGINWEGEAHDAMVDVRITWQLFLRLVKVAPRYFDVPGSLERYLSWQDATAKAQEADFQRYLARVRSRVGG